MSEFKRYKQLKEQINALDQKLKRVEQDLYAMNVAKHEYDGSAPPVLGLPYGISCGLAGGNWGIIKAMIEDIFLDSPIQCYIVKFDMV